ncbi:MAG: helix-turn-helix transcriptional regulator [Actinomycetota bacterium]|nr:helix-turn-helix transcriptional regulator [Actinomycetota bacterium]
MPRPVSARQAELDIVRHCHSELKIADLRHQVLRSLRRLMPIDAVFFATADPETLLFTGAYSEEPLATGHDRMSSVRYRDIMRPLGLGDELRAALVAGAECWGYLCLHRTEHRLGFTPAEAAALARVGPHIAHAVRQAVLRTRSTGTGDASGPGVVLLADDLNVVAITPQAEHLLSLIDSGPPTGDPLPVAVRAAAVALVAVERGTATQLPSVRVATRAGRWLTVHASRLQGPGEDRIAVVLEPTEARASAPLMLAAYGLSRREAEVARLVLRGASTRVIADALHISRHTVQDHLKAVFDKVGVRSRRDLVGRLLDTASPGRST